MKRVKVSMLRPTLYRIFIYLVIGALAAALWDRFVNTDGFFVTRTRVTPLVAILFAAAAWFRYLGLRKRGRARKRPAGGKRSGGMLDFVDTDPDPDGELTSEEKGLCTIAAALFCCIVSPIAALI